MAILQQAEAHEHDWHLVQIDFDEGVREFSCTSCQEVWFA